MPFLFAATLFLSALLLFLVQLMVGQRVLPYLGGSPAVWNTCMVFFQAVLLGGYLYADTVSRWLSGRRQLVLHVALLLLPLVPLFLLQLDVGLIAREWLPPPTEANPIPWLLLVLLIVVGLPFLVIATSAPLLQKWFAQTVHPSARDPYFLYAASNLGSMLALIGYPTIIQKHLHMPLPTQAGFWIAGYAVLVLLTLLCGLLARRGAAAGMPGAVSSSPAEAAPAKAEEGERVSFGRRLRWVALAFVPSSLMLGATTYITTDIAAVPLLWVLPLALYLLSFILVFANLSGRWYVAALVGLGLIVGVAVLARWDWLDDCIASLRIQLANRQDSGLALTLGLVGMTIGSVVALLWSPRLLHLAMVLLLPAAILLVACQNVRYVFLPFLDHPIVITLPAWARVVLHLTALFLAAMVCHGELARTRPPTRYLTEFYLLLSLGGVLGGMFTALAAPLLFKQIAEYPLVMALALILMPRAGARPGQRGLFLADLNLGGVLGLLGMLIGAFWLGQLFLTQQVAEDLPEPFRDRAIQFVRYYGRDDSSLLLEERSFFGLMRVYQYRENYYHLVQHGTTWHGLQCYGDPDRWGMPLAYFHPDGPMGDIWAAARARKAREPNSRTLPVATLCVGAGNPLVVPALLASQAPLRIAVIGIGSGTLAAYTRSGDELTLYEIDPAVVRMVEDREYFTYLPDARARGVRVQVALGDGRLQMRKAEPGQFDLIFMDAFTSDAVPVHLLTREAVEMYLTKLAPGGAIIINVSNRHLDFRPVFGNLAANLGLVGCSREGRDDNYWEDTQFYEQFASTWVVLARREQDLGNLRFYQFEEGGKKWDDLPRSPAVGVWTDDYCNLLAVFHWKF